MTALEADNPTLFDSVRRFMFVFKDLENLDDIAIKTQTTLDKDALIKLEQQIDKQTFADAYGLLLFQLPGVFGVNARVDGVKYMGNQNGPFWNFWEWSVKSSKK